MLNVTGEESGTMRILLALLAFVAPVPAWAGDPIPGVEFYLVGKLEPDFRNCLQTPGATRINLKGETYCMVPDSALRQVRMKGDFSRFRFLTRIPGPVFGSDGECTGDRENSIVVLNGARFCIGPASAISHNSSRSNYSR